MHIRIKKGLDIPIKGEPTGPVVPLSKPSQIALNVDRFEEVKFKILAQVGDRVKIGQPLLLDKKHPERLFTSPAGGTLKEIRRGLKRRLLSLVIDVDDNEEFYTFEPLTTVTPDALLERGLFANIRMRPFDLLANPKQTPKAIFIKAIESAPFVPPAKLQVEGHEQDFQAGIDALAQLTPGPVHLIHREGFEFAKNCEIHTASGPHPISNPSVHIHAISPISSIEDIVWTVNAHDVLSIGHMVRTGKAYTECVIGIGGEGIAKDKRQFVRARIGCPLAQLFEGRSTGGRLISGDPLNGRKAEIEEFLGFDHFAFSVIPETEKRQFLHFLRPGLGKYSALKAYFSGHIPKKSYSFTTNQHGEERAFIDGSVYDRVMPMRIPTMPLVKSILSQDWDQAELLGLLEVAPEDFALPTFVCPSKVEMCQIVRDGLMQYAEEMIH